ncbi:GGDEF domain-containing protein [Psychrobium sp. 1_MG-2023]|uniref:GGDEF domain-containing protein n=1 Tax=Psychrobium sp. 1_MG-2023 TaxID=3062624 RepID=UPI000C32C048|nr:GGDEF domain-containing protein [Psychrobium sp. 1_MG-2023]MDP2560586.1 GGDEF domain-containing protein [Psychrobium sp. 1_MG-2023]PKF57573.1 GGDEF domain-containing protein [Alteromonadales bacterium alter-6D02]
MKFSENSNQAADFLRQAVPKMIKHNIVPNPLNYTLWYSYFSKAFPNLNKELDHTIERFGTCPPATGEALFLEHISQLSRNGSAEVEKFGQALVHLVSDLSETIDESAKQSEGFADALKQNITELDSHSDAVTLSPLLDKLSQNATAICDTHQQLQQQMTSAQAEIQSLKQQLESSKQQASTDPLTGLYNRRVFEDIYQRFESDASNENMTLIMMDIDKFKVFNDTHGHLMGDQILKFVGHLLKDMCKEPSVPVRLGGEEFAVLCPSASINAAQAMAEKLRAKLESVPFTNKRTGQKIAPVTASFGVAEAKGKEVLAQVIERADQALYAAKDAGRNQVKLAC